MANVTCTPTPCGPRASPALFGQMPLKSQEEESIISA